jgi:hypothetical protein
MLVIICNHVKGMEFDPSRVIVSLDTVHIRREKVQIYGSLI